MYVCICNTTYKLNVSKMKVFKKRKSYITYLNAIIKFNHYSLNRND